MKKLKVITEISSKPSTYEIVEVLNKIIKKQGEIIDQLNKQSGGGIQEVLDEMPQYVMMGTREYYLDFYIKSIDGERYYCSCYTNGEMHGDTKLTPEYDEKTLLKSLIKTRDYLSKLKE